MNLPKGWYVFASIEELKAKRIVGIRRFGRDWAIWKNKNGNWIAQLDRCPHRGARLTLGRISNDCIECPFHGFRFDSSGVCEFVPELGRNAPGLRVETHSLIDRYGFLWINWGEVENKGLNWFAELESNEYTYSWANQLWQSHFSRCVESQLDYAHLPFVHSNSIGKNFDPKRKIRWELEKEFIRVYLGEESNSTGYFEFRFPNVWKLYISPRLSQTLAFVPVDEYSTMIYSRSYHQLTQIPILRQLIAWISAKIANPYILSQDQRVVLSQSPLDTRDAGNEALFPSDKAIGAFRKWLVNEYF